MIVVPRFIDPISKTCVDDKLERVKTVTVSTFNLIYLTLGVGLYFPFLDTGKT